jgi:hypothetical protein
MTMCPNHHDVVFPVTTVPPLSICPVCGRTVVVENDNAIFATADDTATLTDAQRRELKKLRPNV